MNELLGLEDGKPKLKSLDTGRDYGGGYSLILDGFSNR